MSKNAPLHIGFDAKRAFFNKSGLGNYSRDLIHVLSQYEDQNTYYLFKHKDASGIAFETSENVKTIVPSKRFFKRFGSVWRSFAMSTDIRKTPISIYHGLSHELPIGIKKAGVKTVVTMHDCIFLRYPELYDLSFRLIFKLKYAYACKVADRIIAISEQSKQDVMHYFKVPEEKIDVVYQGCNTAFYHAVSEDEKKRIRAKYKLPEQFILNVGTIEERKNLLSVFKGLKKAHLNTPVVALGRSTNYTDKVKAFVKENKQQGIFIHDADFKDFPAIYQMARCMAYPSVFEGFGIPILEALNSGTPVITTKGGVFPEVGGEAALYVDYGNEDEMAEALKQILQDEKLRNTLATKGKKQALKFREAEIAQNLMNVYRKLCQ